MQAVLLFKGLTTAVSRALTSACIAKSALGELIGMRLCRRPYPDPADSELT